VDGGWKTASKYCILGRGKFPKILEKMVAVISGREHAKYTSYHSIGHLDSKE